jgi:hypothetical protein
MNKFRDMGKREKHFLKSKQERGARLAMVV